MPLVDLIIDATDPETDFGKQIYKKLNEPNPNDGELMKFVHDHDKKYSDITMGDIVRLLAHYKKVTKKDPNGDVIMPMY